MHISVNRNFIILFLVYKMPEPISFFCVIIIPLCSGVYSRIMHTNMKIIYSYIIAHRKINRKIISAFNAKFSVVCVCAIVNFPSQ